MPLVKKQYSGKHHGLVNGIDIVNFLWTNGEKMIPIDYRVYDPGNDGKTKNDHAKEMLEKAKSRGFKPKAVLMDSWFTSIDNLKLIESFGWKWIGGLKRNRLVSEEQGAYVRVEQLDWTSKQVRKVWLKAYGFVQVSKIVATNGDIAVCRFERFVSRYVREHQNRIGLSLGHRDFSSGNQAMLRY